MPAQDQEKLKQLEEEKRIKQLVEESITTSTEVRDRVQSEVNNTFGWTISLTKFLITVLIAISITTSLAVLFLHHTVIDQLVRETKNKLQKETEKEVKEQLEIQVVSKLQKQEL